MSAGAAVASNISFPLFWVSSISFSSFFLFLSDSVSVSSVFYGKSFTIFWLIFLTKSILILSLK